MFLKGSATPVVMYFDNPQAVYAELKQLMKSPTPVLVEKEPIDLLKTLFCFNTNGRLSITRGTLCTIKFLSKISKKADKIFTYEFNEFMEEFGSNIEADLEFESLGDYIKVIGNAQGKIKLKM